MKIAMACDHGGLRLKNVLKEDLEKNDYEVVDFGTYTEESCDYPDYASKAAKAVADGTCDKGVVVCGTGIGVSITANKVNGIRWLESEYEGERHDARIQKMMALEKE